MDYISIDNFEGPLDLLLHLVKESNIDICDIKIDEITEKYLDYIRKQDELNINVSSSYLVMASELMYIKSKSLLPKVKNDNDEEVDEELTRENLINKLIEYKKYKELSKNLYFFIGDLDNLKYINDTFGHDQGDKAIQTVCEILNDIFQTHAVIGRLGGDEFGIAFTCKNEDFIIQIDSLIQERTQYFNKKYHLPYYVSLSYGISVFDYNSPFDLNHTIRLADTLMYERKKEKHIQRGKKG